MILNDKEIIKQCKENNMICPVSNRKHKEGLSWGLEPFGYTIRLHNTFQVLNCPDFYMDPKEIKASIYQKTYANLNNQLTINPSQVILGRSVEAIIMPNNIIALAYGKSTYARLGLIINITPIDAGWRGFLTISIYNFTPKPIIIYANEGIAQLVFFKGEKPDVTYNGHYQNSEKIKGANV